MRLREIIYIYILIDIDNIVVVLFDSIQQILYS